jgi:glycosyltransferase involved in cell wall biosynthesis
MMGEEDPRRNGSGSEGRGRSALAKAKISACLITRDDAKVASAVASIRKHVDEVCICDTGSKPEQREKNRKLADRFVVFQGCNDEQGRIVDFSAARQKSFELATGDWILWLDSDDEVVGSEYLESVLEQAQVIADSGQKVRILCPYEYAFDQADRCVTLQWRERILSGPASQWSWLRPVHEGVVVLDRTRMQDVRCEHVKWRHRKGMADREPGRNLRILRFWMEREPSKYEADPRLFYDLAVECRLAGFYDEALHHVEKYLKLSNWPEERKLAGLLASDMELRRALGSLGPDVAVDLTRAKEWAKGAIDDLSDFDANFAMASLCYLESTLAKIPRLGAEQLADAIRYGERALDKVGEYGPLSTNPVARGVDVHTMLHDAYARIGDCESALEHVSKCVDASPEDPRLRLTKRQYERKVGMHRAEAGSGKLDFVFACAHTAEPWSPPTAKKNGIGGSETAVIAVAEGLAKRGHRVRVFCDCDQPGLHDEVEWCPLEELYGLEGSCDLFVAWRDAIIAEGGYYPNFAPKTKAIWAHDLDVANFTHARSLLVQRVVCVSEWHKRFFCETNKVHPDQVLASRNGIHLERFDVEGARRNPKKVVYSSSPERGLPSLLGMWPKIKARVPDAELHVYYGVAVWEAMAKKFKSEMARGNISNLLGRLELMKPFGVHTRGRVNQAELAKEFLSAGVWSMPTWFAETSCITSQEAQAAGLRIVTSRGIGAMEETTGDRGAYVEGDWLSPEYQAEFVEKMVEALGAPAEDEERARAREFARANFSWEGVVDDWEKLAKLLMAEAEDFVLPPYQGVL